MYAIVRTGGHQEKVAVGDEINVNRLAHAPGDTVTLPALLVVRTVVYFYFGMFHGLWRYTGARDLITLFKAASASTALFVLYVHFAGPHGMPRSVFILDWLLSIFAVGGLRFGIRTLREITHQVSVAARLEGRRKILVGHCR